MFFRYAITLLPALALLQAWTIRAVWPVSRPLAVAALALALVVDRADLLHASAGSPLLKCRFVLRLVLGFQNFIV